VASELPAGLEALAWAQRGVLTARQAIEGGLTREIIRSRMRQGRWQRLHTGVFATFTGQPERLAILWAAVLRVGPGAMLSYHTAAELGGLADRPASLIHVTDAERRPGNIPGVVVHLSRRAQRALHPVLTPPQTRIEETVLDLAASEVKLDDAYGWITRAVGRRLTTQARLCEAMELRARMRWRRELGEALGPDAGGVHSLLELRYLRGVERPHRLPRGIRQARVRTGGHTGYRDVLYAAYSVAVELDGQAAHQGDRRWLDVYRDNAAAARGVITLRYGWLDVSRHPCVVAAQVAEVLRLRGCSGYRGCSAGCPVAVVAGEVAHRGA
jgi:hypothetical protein